MFSIGEFARHGRVSVRMLRHYDAVGLLTAAHVDASTGYRWYEADQLSRLNHIVALKDLGFTLLQVRSILDEKVGIDELHGMLRLRQAQLESQIVYDTARLARVRARLRIIEKEGTMPSEDIQVKPLPAMTVAELTATAAGFEPASISPVIGPLYDELVKRLAAAGLAPPGPALAYYDDGPDSDVLVHAAFPVQPGSDLSEFGVAVVDLPEVERAATIVHHGSMDGVLETVQLLARWIDANGYRSLGYNRELYLSAGEDRTQWVTELQEPILLRNDDQR